MLKIIYDLTSRWNKNDDMIEQGDGGKVPAMPGAAAVFGHGHGLLGSPRPSVIGGPLRDANTTSSLTHIGESCLRLQSPSNQLTNGTHHPNSPSKGNFS